MLPRFARGKFSPKNGDKYVGELKDGKQNGQGTYTSADGGKYEGEFKDGNMNGQGTHTYADGAKYVGEWARHMVVVVGKAHGGGGGAV